ncbi:2,4-dienoyl-CoA reductase-like NADH-dependent reductase (Old Yellow Enzyme family) [Amycolatopsis bartoniae]|uniref:Uncharacterized protein n=1 Tax=Amycolatopsis bartoniae TaxID=941986 RepID=A0A8H9ITJ6_9PSEU|nr:hypothetical protein [Amycolatopsis bartoniae]MBB2939698.1 2,4-dienoyl-CoA reductase-like NADH-dependent reductase (Old Yellow Enzyme family) [Amycolatopsis bartoniae]TVT06183.1 hypothetical protein FNH07_21195 [Amycolatopsis bartoniae]GHF36420.1 hypothetical protein GCM10017566_06900 [Amycolatopsis bartoniae]
MTHFRRLFEPFHDDLVIPALRERAQVVQAEGARCFARLAHGGGSQHWPVMAPPLGPSNVPDPYDGHVPHQLTDEQIEGLIVAFAHGQGGGSVENRARFLREILAAARELVGDESVRTAGTSTTARTAAAASAL